MDKTEDKKLNITVDFEGDYGGRTSTYEGIRKGTPLILDILKQYSKKAIFFISTETLYDNFETFDKIRKAGHEIGAHGHFHTKYRESFRQWRDIELSRQIIGSVLKKAPGSIPFRAPKFYIENEDHIYSCKKNHVSVLKRMWVSQHIPNNPIIYLHPFDLIKPTTLPPNLFCAFWYSNPKKAIQVFENLLRVI